MLIGVTAPKKGMGQTVTAINMGAALAQRMCQKVLIADMNCYCEDVETYLSDTDITKGMDDFFNLHNAGVLCAERFKACVKKAHKHMDIMAGSKYFEIEPDQIDVLTAHIRNTYGINIIDTVSGINHLTQVVLKKVDIVVVVLNQIKNAVELIKQNPSLQSERTIFIINRYIEEINKNRITYNINKLSAQLNDLGFTQPVFTLTFDISLMNECNDGTLLNYVMGRYQTQYLRELDDLVNHLINMKAKHEHRIVFPLSKEKKPLFRIPIPFKRYGGNTV